MKASVGQGTLKLGPFQGAPGHAVAVAAGSLPAILTLDVGSQAEGPGFRGVRLVLLVGRYSGVDLV